MLCEMSGIIYGRKDKPKIYLSGMNGSFYLEAILNFSKKVFLSLMHPFSCALWAIFWFFSLLFFVR